MALIYAHLLEPPPSMRAARPELADAIDHVVAKAMAKKPDERYASAQGARCGRPGSAVPAGSRPLARAGRSPVAPARASGRTATAEPPTPRPSLPQPTRAPVAASRLPPIRPEGWRRKSDRSAERDSGIAAASWRSASSAPSWPSSSSAAEAGEKSASTTTPSTSTNSRRSPWLRSACSPRSCRPASRRSARPSGAASYGAVQTELCHPPANAPTSSPQDVLLLVLSQSRRAPSRLRRPEEQPRPGRLRRSSQGQRDWIHLSTGKTGGVRVCGTPTTETP